MMLTVKKQAAKKSVVIRRVFVLLICIILFIGVLFIVNHVRRPDPPKFTGPVENISTGLIGEYASLILIAQEKGYFSDYGLNVTIQEYPSGPASLEDLLAGKIDTAMASDFAGVRNTLKGEDLRILGNMSQSEAFFMIARKDHGISEVSDLKDKKIGITRKTVGEFYLGQFLTFNMLSLGDIEIIDMPQVDLVKALDNKEIDAAVLFEPNAYRAKSSLGDNAVRWSIQSGQSINSLLYSRDQLVRERPHVIERYLRAVVAAENYVKNRSDEAKGLIGKRLGYDVDYINYIWPNFKFNVTLEQELLLTMDDQARWAIENKLTDAKTTPNYLDVFYLDGLTAAKPDGVTVIR